MKPFLARNVGFGLPNCRYYKVELVTENGPAIYGKIGGAKDENEALAAAIVLLRDDLAGAKVVKHRVIEIDAFSAVLSNKSVKVGQVAKEVVL